LQGYDIQKLEDQIFAEELEFDELSNTNLRMTERQQRKHNKLELHIQQGESLAKYFLSLPIVYFKQYVL
jgi:hypothetical protein